MKLSAAADLFLLLMSELKAGTHHPQSTGCNTRTGGCTLDHVIKMITAMRHSCNDGFAFLGGGGVQSNSLILEGANKSSTNKGQIP